ncbi:MAG: alpha/beta fold hydrolase [Bdellovibrio sp.]|nr:alpha/beta fold hydrolase [Bdellovibrio sp.]
MGNTSEGEKNTVTDQRVAGLSLPSGWNTQVTTLRSYNSKDSCHVKKITYRATPNLRSNALQIFLVHDIFEHHLRWYPLVENLVQDWSDNYQLVLHDLKGHGLSTGTRMHIEDFSIYCKDLATLINLSKESRNEKCKVVLIGQGMGALVILKAIEQYRHLIDAVIGGLILINPSFKLAFQIPYSWQGTGQNFFSALSKIRLARPFNGQDLFALTTDAEDYNADPLIPRFLSLGLMSQLLKSTKEMRQFSYFVDVPSLFICGKHGPLFDPDSAFLFHKGIPNTESLYLQYPEEKHGLLYGENKQEIITTIKNWIQKIGDNVI